MKDEEIERPDFTNGGGSKIYSFSFRFVHVIMKML